MKLYRGGSYKTSDAFFALDKSVASMYGKKVYTFSTKKQPKLFTITHNSLKSVFKYLSENTKLLLKLAFGTGLTGKTQNVSYKFLFGKKPKKGHAQRMSVSDIDTLALAGFSKEYLLKRGYDGAYMPRKKTRFHKGVFHREVYIARRGILVKEKEEDVGIKKGEKSLKTSMNMSQLFIKYTKHTTTLLKARRSFVHFLGGGMAVKLYLIKRGIKTAETKDFDFKFAVPRAIRSQKQIDILSHKMKALMTRHLNGFVRWLNRHGIHSNLSIKELVGVPLDKPNRRDFIKHVYKVYTFSINGKELVDTSLVCIPGIHREKHISRRLSKYYGMPIPSLNRLWRDTLYVLAASFVIPTAKLRNPINGNKKEKGIKNAIRAGHLSYITSRRKRTAYLVHLSRKLIEDIILRNKKKSTTNSKKILGQLHLLQKADAISSKKN